MYMHVHLSLSAGFTYKLYRLKPRASRSKGGLQQTVVRIEQGWPNLLHVWAAHPKTQDTKAAT